VVEPGPEGKDRGDGVGVPGDFAVGGAAEVYGAAGR